MARRVAQALRAEGGVAMIRVCASRSWYVPIRCSASLRASRGAISRQSLPFSSHAKPLLLSVFRSGKVLTPDGLRARCESQGTELAHQSSPQGNSPLAPPRIERARSRSIQRGRGGTSSRDANCHLNLWGMHIQRRARAPAQSQQRHRLCVLPRSTGSDAASGVAALAEWAVGELIHQLSARCQFAPLGDRGLLIDRMPTLRQTLTQPPDKVIPGVDASVDVPVVSSSDRIDDPTAHERGPNESLAQ